MTQEATAASTASTTAGGENRGLIRRAFAIRRGSGDVKGGGAHSPRRLLAVLALAIAAFAVTAAPALAAPPTVTTPVISKVSYASAEVTGKVTTDGSGAFGGTAYAIQYSTDGINWTTAKQANLAGAGTKAVEATLEGLKGPTTYFVRIAAENFVLGGPVTESTSPEPNPSFTTLAVDPPAILNVENASDVAYTTATATGEITRPANPDPAFDASCNFQYITPADFAVQRNEVQELTVGGEGGTFRLTFQGQTTSPVAFDASAAALQAELEALSSIPAGGLTVGASPGASAPYTIAFEGPLGNANVPQLLTGGSKLTGSEATPASITATTITEGRSEGFEGATEAPCETANPGETPGTVTAPGNSKVSAHLANLANNTTYHLRLVVSNASTTTDGEAAPSTFKTLTVDPPSVKSVENASEVEYTQAQVKGVVERPNNADPAFDVECNFEYVSDAQFTQNEAESLPPFSGATPIVCEPNPVTEADTTPGTTKEVEATLPGLLPSTTYHLRLSATNQGGSDSKAAAATFVTQGPVPKPTVIATGDATDVGIHEAHASGQIQRPVGNDPALDTSCHFEFITDAQYQANLTASAPAFEGASLEYCTEHPPWVPLTSTQTDPAEVTATLPGLKPATTYHLRLVAENNFGTNVEVKEAADTFTTLPAELPAVILDPIEGGTFTTVHVTGTVDVDDPGHPSTQSAFEVSEDGGITWSGFLNHENPTLAGTGPHVVERTFTGLHPTTTYTFRLAATYSTENGEIAAANGEMAYSAGETITTGELFPPTAEDLEVTEISGTSAHLSGTVDPHAPAGPLSPLAKKAFATHWEFVCVPECKNANGNTIEGTVQGEEGEQPVFGDVERLEPGTEYKVSLIVKSEGGGETKEVTFTTKVIPPSVQSTPGAPDGEGGYTLQGVVNPNNHMIAGCKFKWGPNSNELVFSAVCSPSPSPGAKPTTVEAHLTGLNAGAHYHSQLVVEYDAGLKADSGDPLEFVPVPAVKEPCPANEALRIENSSTALPECRAYEMVSPSGKEGFGAEFKSDVDGGDRVRYISGAGNIAKSGQNIVGLNSYVATRTAVGWETIPNLNGSSGSIYDAPSEVDSIGPQPEFYSADLLSSVWTIHKKGDLAGEKYYLRNPNGTFTLIGSGVQVTSRGAEIPLVPQIHSADLSHLVVGPTESGGTSAHPKAGLGVYEFIGTGVDLPRRVDLDNSGSPVSSCIGLDASGQNPTGNALGKTISSDGRVVVFTAYGALRAEVGTCGVGSPPAEEIWARVGGTTSFDVSASHCNRTAADPGGVCNAPADPKFVAATPDGSRVFFTTAQQLVDGDTDQGNDIYACDIPPGDPVPTAEKANPCSAFSQISVAESGAAEVENVLSTSDNGSTVLLTAKGVLAANEDALDEKALAGDNNLYIWRQDSAHPAGRTTFVARFDSNDARGQATADGQYLVFSTANQLVPTDTDNARDVYRVDAETGELTRVSTNIFGVGGNGPFDAEIPSSGAVSDNGQKIVFTTTEALSPADGNAKPDVYLWTPGRVSLITTGSVGAGGIAGAIDGSGQDIFFGTSGALTPADDDSNGDVYDARVDGGFSFAHAAACSGETCRLSATPSPAKKAPSSEQPSSGNPPQPKPCPKGKVKKHGKCVKKASKKHHKGSHKKNKRTASHGPRR